MLSWVLNYLSNRQARVRVAGAVSEYQDLENGTPQGSVISPMLFNMLINEIVAGIKKRSKSIEVISYADDLAIVAKGPHAVKAMRNALHDLNWLSKEHGLKINVEKTQIMNFTTRQHEFNIGSVKLTNATTYKYLGITIDRQFRLHTHAKYLKASSQQTKRHEGSLGSIKGRKCEDTQNVLRRCDTEHL